MEAANKKNRWMVWKVERKDGGGWGGGVGGEWERKRRGDCGGKKSRKALPAITHSVSLARRCCATIFH